METATSAANPARKGQDIYKTCLSMIEFCSSSRTAFNNDLDQMLVYIVLMLDDLQAGDGSARSRGVNAMSLSQITRIPRESVRRKLSKLQAANIVERGDDGLWRHIATPRDLIISRRIDRHFRLSETGADGATASLAR
jgi:hypothetical protein